MSLVTWSWIFLFGYMSLMVGIGTMPNAKSSMRMILQRPRCLRTVFSRPGLCGVHRQRCDLLVARPCPMSGAFLPFGCIFVSGWGLCRHFNFHAPGCQFGNRFGNRSIPEYLGDRYQSDTMRLMVSLISLVLFFYLAGQLVSGIVIEIMLGLDSAWALGITTLILLIYVVLGGAHADILTDGVQGFMMLLLAVLVIVLTVLAGWPGGFSGLVDNLAAQDEDLVSATNPNTPLFHSWWSIFVIAFAHMPLGCCRTWQQAGALDSGSLVHSSLSWQSWPNPRLTGPWRSARSRLFWRCSGHASGANPNQALPLLFIELFPPGSLR